MADSMLEGGLGALAFARKATLGFVEDIPDDQLCYQVSPGTNHVLWNLGHLARADDYFLSGLGDRPAKDPEHWGELFGMGSKPTSDPGDYPSKTELLEAMSDRRTELIAWFESMSPEQARTPLPGDFAEFAAHYAALASTIAWHEGMHAGQIAVIRQALKLAPKFG